MADKDFTFQPIGVIHTPFKRPEETPIQGVFSDPKIRGVVEVFEPFEEGLRDVQLFSHLYLLYLLDRAKTPRLICTPFLDDEPRGIFATRAPWRPNPIGLSIVRLISRDDRHLHVADVDILDGTPLLDIKPYIPAFDHRTDARSGWLTTPPAKPPTPSKERWLEPD